MNALFPHSFGRAGRRLFVTAGIAALAAFAAPCSVCIAHALGAGLRALGAQTLHRGKTVIGISYSSFSKKNGGEEKDTEEKHRHRQMDLDVLHGLSNQWMLHANVPFVEKRLSETGEESDTSRGIGDVTVGASYQVPPKLGDKVLFGFNAEVKLPTGRNNMRKDGEIKEEHAQLGTGSTDMTVGVLATTEDKSQGLWFAEVSYRWNGDNDRGFRYGNALFYNLGYSRPLDERSSWVAELNGRVAKKDELAEGGHDPNSGGHLGYLSLSYRRNIGPDMGLIIGYQHPVLKDLHGSQSESGLFTIGVSRRL